MSKPTTRMVYSAMTEAQTLRQFEAGAAEAAREGYEPVAQSWDGTTLTVTYAPLDDQTAVGPSRPHDPGSRPNAIGIMHWSRPAVALSVLLLIGFLAAGAVVLLNETV